MWQDTVTDKERWLVKELKKRLINDCTPKMLEDETLFYRFIKARNFNLKDAEMMLRNHLSFRKEYQVDTIITDYKCPEVLELCPMTDIGYDKEGNCIRYFDLGRCDAKTFIHAAKKVDIVKINIKKQEQAIENMMIRSKKLGINANKIVFIYNFENLTLAVATYKKAIDFLILAIKIMQNNYPERIKQIYNINVSSYFNILFLLLKPFLAPALQEKIQFCGTDFQEALLETIDPDVLPAFLGGNRTDPDGNPNCYSTVNWGMVLPEKYHRRKRERGLSSSPGVRKLSVTRFSKSDVQFEVLVPDSTLEWEFETQSRDIGFGVFFRADPGSKLQELVPKQRLDTDVEPEIGVCKCTMPGTYIIVFDNSYSWFYPKEIFYKARVVGPDDEVTDTLGRKEET